MPNFQRQRGPAGPRIGGFRADAPPPISLVEDVRLYCRLESQTRALYNSRTPLLPLKNTAHFTVLCGRLCTQTPRQVMYCEAQHADARLEADTRQSEARGPEDSEGRRVVKREARRVVEVKRIVVHARRFGGAAWYSPSTIRVHCDPNCWKRCAGGSHPPRAF